jgi:hypothetical protein
MIFYGKNQSIIAALLITISSYSMDKKNYLESKSNPPSQPTNNNSQTQSSDYQNTQNTQLTRTSKPYFNRMSRIESKVMQVTWLLKLSYGIAVIIAGFDKMPFLNKITSWQLYISPTLIELLPISAPSILMISGIAEIIVGALIIIKPRIGASIAIAWLALIIINLLSMNMYFDIAIRDALLIVALLALVLLDTAK